MQQYQYKAFISYRHQFPDQEIARKLHTMIETFRIPAALRTDSGANRMGRVFRDQEELTLSKDLGTDIRTALDNSEWLIAICSPRYLESQWCLAELDHFIRTGKRDHILVLLVEGEPSEVFPPQLCSETVNGETVKLEPLAADVRDATLQGSLKKLQNEKLRILAPMLDVNYDDLRQRARQRRNRIFAAAAAGIFAVLSGFLGYAVIKNGQITQERNSAQIAESKWLAQSAQEALDNGDKMLSLLLSLQALPENFDDPEKPLVKEALAPLRSAIASGLGDNLYQPATRIDVPGLESCRGHDNLLYCFSRQTDGFISAYNMVTGKEEQPVFTVPEEPAAFMHAEAAKGYSVYEHRVAMSNGMYTDTELSGFTEKDSYLAGGGDYKLAETKNGGYLLLQKGDGAFSGFQWYSDAYRDYAGEGSFNPRDVKSLHRKDGAFFLGGYFSSSEAQDGPAVICVDTITSAQNNVLQRYYLDGDQYIGSISSSSFALLDIDSSVDDDIIAGRSYYCIFFWNVKDPQVAWTFPCNSEQIAFSSKDNYLLAMRTDEGKVQILDCREQKIVQEFRNGLYSVTDFMWNTDGTRLLLTCSDDRARIVSISDGEVLQTLSCGFSLNQARYADETYFGDSANDNFIILLGEDTVQTYVLNSNKEQQSAVGKIENYAATLYNDTYIPRLHQINITEDGKTIWNYREDGLYVTDAETLETLKVFEGDTTTSGRLLISPEYVYSVHGNVNVYDPETLELKAELDTSYPHSFTSSYSGQTEDRSSRGSAYQAEVSADGSLLMTEYSKPDFYGFQFDPAVFVFSTEDFRELWHVAFAVGEDGDEPFDFAKDWEGYRCLRSEFIAGGSKTLLLYVYDPRKLTDYRRDQFTTKTMLRIVFEVRDSLTGEVESTYWFPYEIDEFYLDHERCILLIQDAGGDVHVMDALTGEELVLLEQPGTIFDYEFGDGTVWLCYRYAGTDGFAPEGSEIRYREGAVNRFDAKTVFTETRCDGVFGDQPIRAEDDGLYDAEDGTPVLTWSDGEYYFLRSWNDGSKILCFVPYNDGSLFSGGKNGDIAVIRCLSPAELRDIALSILDGRELTEEQKKKYFIE